MNLCMCSLHCRQTQLLEQQIANLKEKVYSQLIHNPKGQSNLWRVFFH